MGNCFDEKIVNEVSDELCEHCESKGDDNNYVREYDEVVVYPIGKFHYLHDDCKFELDQEFKLTDEEVELFFDD